MVSKNTHCIALQNMLTVTVIVTLQRVTLGNTRGAMVSKNTHCIALQNMLTVTVIVTLQRVTLGNTRGAMVSKKNVKCNTQLHNKGDHYVTHEGQ